MCILRFCVEVNADCWVGFQIVGFFVGYATQQLSLTVYIILGGFVLSGLVSFLLVFACRS